LLAIYFYDRLASRDCALTRKQGSEDAVYGTQIPAEQLKLFTSSKEIRFSIIPGGAHYLNATNPTEVDAVLLELVTKYS